MKTILRIGLQDVPVRRRSDLPDHGRYNETPTLEILVGQACVPRSRMWYTTVFHEVMHSLLSQFGTNAGLSDEQEELVVRTMEIGLCSFFRDNPEFISGLLESLDG